MSHAALNLDFSPRRPPWGDYALLSAALVVVMAVVLLGVQARADAQSAAARLQQRSARDLRAEQGAALAERQSRLPAEVKRSLATPWSALLSDLESQAARSGGDVALLRIEPDRANASLLLVAEARTLPAALKYVQQLQRLPSLSRAVLQSHEVLQEDPQRPVRVQIVASWRQGA